jgi:lysozyme
VGALINECGLGIIKKYEGLRLDVYRDPIGIPTIGYGSIWGIDGDRVRMDHRKVTEEEAGFLLQRDVGKAERYVGHLIDVPITINMFSATVSLVYNIGSGNFQNSQIRMRINRKNYAGAAAIWWQWRRARGRIYRGLVLRRAMERELFLDEISDDSSRLVN